eukprot:g6142.t1
MLGANNTGGVRLRVQRIDGSGSIKTATVRPVRSGARVVSIGEHGVEVLVPSPARFTLSVDGGLDETDTGPSYKGSPMHTFCAFVNPYLATPSGAGTHVVRAGDAVPSQLPNGTRSLVFDAGEHRLTGGGHWPVYTLPATVRVHVSAGAVLYFALNGTKYPSEPRSYVLEGYGTVSGEEMLRCPPSPGPNYTARAGGACPNHSPQGLSLSLVDLVAISGVTFVDFPNHHIIAGAKNVRRQDGCGTPSSMENVKVLGWRANGDGIHVFGHWRVADCFLRTQDDSLYLQATNSPQDCATLYEGITTWNDANGAAFMLIGIGGVLRASDAIYQRASWAWWDGGRILTNRQQGRAVNVTVDDLVASDPFPTMNAINIDMRPGSASGKEHTAPATAANVAIRNLHVRAFSTVRSCPGFAKGCSCVPDCGEGALPRGIPNRVLAGPSFAQNNITSIAFVNSTVGGVDMAEVLSSSAANVTWAFVARGGITVDGKPLTETM